jgi:hypothetical protein
MHLRSTARVLVLIMVLGCALLPALAAAQPAAQVPPSRQVPSGGGRLLLEGGWAVPLGDLADGLDETPTGVGARPGFELGLRWRFALSPSWSLAPCAHFLGYGDATGLGVDGEDSLSPVSLRYGIEVLLASARRGTKPFVGLTPCVVYSRLSGPGKDHVTLIEDSNTGFGISARAGLRFGGTEVSAVYHLNRFSSFGFFETGAEQDYNWDTVVLRFGWHLP